MASKSHRLSHWLGSWMSARLCRHTELSENRRVSQRDREHICLSDLCGNYIRLYYSTDFLVGVHKHMYCVEKCLGKPDHNHLFIQDVNSFNQF